MSPRLPRHRSLHRSSRRRLTLAVLLAVTAAGTVGTAGSVGAGGRPPTAGPRSVVGSAGQATAPEAASRTAAAEADPPRAAASLTAASLTAASLTASSVGWWSGAASVQAADGAYGAWRHSTVQIGGTWNDTYDAQLNEWSICPGEDWGTWNKPLDVAVGGIYSSRGDTWAAAARGAYDARWTAALTQIRTCWGRRDPGLLYLRFAHEMNLDTSDWAVHGGQEPLFVRAITRFSNLRYKIIPRAKIVLCTNDGTSSDLGGLDIRKLWPGRDGQGRQVANLYSTDSYNQYPYVTTAAGFAWKINDQYADGAPLGIEKHREFAARMGVPFAISEWGTSGDPNGDGGGGDSPVYVRLFNAWARAHAGSTARPVAGQLLYEIQFNLWTQFELWPSTLQPRTAAAYRTLQWGH